MVAISVDSPEKSKVLQATLADKGGLEIPLLSDPEHEAVKAFGVYDHAHKIALPSIVILDRRGVIVWQHSGSSVFDRPDEVALVARVKQLASRKE
jgi:peroxiredoxin